MPAAQFRFYGSGLPGVRPEDLHGKLIVVEGADGVGRSTQVDLLRRWLEQRGHAVFDTGLTRSANQILEEQQRRTADFAVRAIYPSAGRGRPRARTMMRSRRRSGRRLSAILIRASPPTT